MAVQPIAIPQSLATALTSAGEKSGVDFDYLLHTAMQESGLNPAAKASSSSATGLFQFLDSTWLQVMKEQGSRLGYGQYADAISVGGDGEFSVADKATLGKILKLREDPQVSADMAAAFTRSNGAYLQSKFGRMPSPGELYIAHFLGAQGAEQFFTAGLSSPDQSAAALFPKQAGANPTIFYDHGQARSIRDVYKLLVAKQDDKPALDPTFVTQQLATDGSSRGSDQAIPSRFSPADLSFTSMFSTESGAPEPSARALINTRANVQPGQSAFFTQLYGQAETYPIPNK
jgi:hypothetical protein